MHTAPRLIALAARLVPSAARAEWKREWTAEVLHRRASLERRGAFGWTARLDLALRILGALPDALAMRRIATRWDDMEAGLFTARPVRTLGACAVLAVAAAVLTVGFTAIASSGASAPGILAVAAVSIGTGLLLASVEAAAGVLTGVPATPIWTRPASAARRHDRDATLVALLGAAEGLALTLAASRWPPTSGAERILSKGLGSGAFAFHAGVSAALAILLALRLRRAPAG